MADSTPEAIADVLNYLAKHKTHALRELDEERQKENWRMVIQIVYELRVIDGKIQLLNQVLKP